MFEKIKKWWNGKDSYDDDRNSSLKFIMPLNQKHWTSKLAHRLVEFYIKYWQFIWGSIIAIICASLRFL